ncbi:MAG: NADH-quinone oxidoreductase subunit L [Chloroflexi bacterium]|nr:NADH-quinone oxidoreductase subunit L [Chloroflexota bacterium]
MSEIAVWFIFLLPLASFVAIAALRPFVGSQWRGAGYITLLSVGGSFVLSLFAFGTVINDANHNLDFHTHDWLTIGGLEIKVGIVMDSLTAVMAIVVTGVSLLVQLYGTEYMRGEKSYARYFAAMSLFTASMLGLIMASNLILIYVFWELVGLCSFLLIGFWFTKPSAANAAKKAFIVTRFGDLGFLIAILWAYVATGTFELEGLKEAVEAGAIAGVGLTWLCLGIFAGAVGKSGQFPLHVWLPDAMEGPTPVSALIHAATMVAAGVFLVARTFFLFEHSEAALTTVAWIGGGTALFAATMALVSNDIKRVMAYSTVSQLGYMMMALGVGAQGPAMFHLFNHAFFKALLFLGAGSIHHAVHTYDMRYMGGLRKVMPWTFITMMVASLSLIGLPPFSGFWSKDAILHSAQETHHIQGGEILFWLGVATAVLTGFYVFRMMFMTFTGAYRGGAEAEAKAAGHHDAHAHDAGGRHEPHLHESPAILLIPLAVLAIPAFASGLADMPGDLLGIPGHWMTEFLGGETEKFSGSVAITASIAGVAGLGLAYLIYVRGAISPAKVGATFKPVYTLLANRWYIDHLYERVIVGRLLLGTVAGVTELVDRAVDGVGNFTGLVTRNLGKIPAVMQNGQVQVSGAVISIGIVVILFAYWVWG